MARGLKIKGRRTQPQLRVNATEALLKDYEETARRFGYGATGPFVRRLLDAAKKGDPNSGMICLYAGTDALDAPVRAA